jgi:sugar phosphate isomerase/epimerase
MENLPFDWSTAEKVTQIAEAGFDGIDVAWTPSLPHGLETIERAGDAGLEWSIITFPKTVDDLKPVAERFSGSAARLVNIQPNVRPGTVSEAASYIDGWTEIARDAGLAVYFETHRDRMTTSLPFTLQLLDSVPSMELVSDLSHFLVGEEFPWPISDENHALIRRVLARTHAFHGRIASREQVQIPLDFPQNQQWVDLFARWWEDGFRLWRERASPGDDLVFVSELGPPWYAITGADGEELSDRWAEAVRLKELARGLWAKLEAA